MGNFQFLFVGKTETYHHTTYTLSDDVNAGELCAYARVVCDAHRALTTPATEWIYAVCWRVDGPTSAANEIHVFHRPGAVPAFRGARTGLILNQFCGLKLCKMTHEGRNVEKWIHASLCRGDMSRLANDKKISIDTKSPLWRVGFPYYKAALSLIPSFDNAHFSDEGAVLDAQISSDSYGVAAPQYLKQNHRLEIRTPQSARDWQERIEDCCMHMRWLCSEYQTDLEQFDYRWGDNVTPLQFRWGPWIADVLTQCGIWYDLHRALGLTEIEGQAVHKVWSYDGGEAATYPGPGFIGYEYNVISPHLIESTRSIEVVPLALSARSLPVALSCIDALRMSQLRIKLAFDLIVQAMVFGGTRPFAPFRIEQYTNTWYCQYFRPPHIYDHDQVLGQERDPSAPLVECSLLTSRDVAQARRWDVYVHQGYNTYGTVFYEQWNALSRAVFDAKNALHLLHATMRPQYAPRVTGVPAVPVPGPQALDSFPRATPEPEDFDLNGSACDWVETYPFDRGPFVQLSFLHQGPQIVKTLPYNPVTTRPVLPEDRVCFGELMTTDIQCVKAPHVATITEVVRWWAERWAKLLHFTIDEEGP